MIEVPILKEIRSYETYIIGHLTTRKLVCGSIAIACAYGCSYLQSHIFGMEQPIGFLIFLAAMPGALFAFKPYGLPMEKFLKTAFIDNFVAPKERPYVLENPMNQMLEKFKYDSEDESEDFDEDILDDTEQPSKKNDKKTKKKQTKKTPSRKLPDELRAAK